METITTMAGIGTLWMIVAFFGCAILSATVAQSKGRSTVAWFFLGFVFNVLALLAIAGMPTLLYRPDPSTHVRCPECRDFVFKDARKCKHCHSRLEPQV